MPPQPVSPPVAAGAAGRTMVRQVKRYVAGNTAQPMGIGLATNTVEERVRFRNHDELRTLFGAQDRNLRRLRDQWQVAVVVRGDELVVQGEADRVDRAVLALHELRGLIERFGELSEPEFDRILMQPPGLSTSKDPGSGELSTLAAGARPNVSSSAGSTTAPSGRSSHDAGAQPALYGEESINVLYKARRVRPMSIGQQTYINAIRDHDLVFCGGPAGSGKTYLATAMAVMALRHEQVRKIVLVRPAVEAGEKLGFLPGDMLEKVNPFLRPLLDSLGDILDYEQVQRYLDRDVIEIIPLAFMRGRTLNNTFMILDEAQNTTLTQMKMFLTRMGHNSKIVVTGDTTQIDLPEHVVCGLTDAMQRLRHVPGVSVVELESEDIVRHPLVRRIVAAYDGDRKERGESGPQAEPRPESSPAPSAASSD